MPWADEEVYKDKSDGYARLAEAVFRANERSAEAFKPLREGLWPRCYSFYHSRHDLSMFGDGVSEYPYTSKVFVPTPCQQVETIAPRLAESLLENDPLVRATPMVTDQEARDAARYEQYARRVETLLDCQLRVDVDLEARLPGWIRDTLIYGTKWLYIDWWVQRGEDWRLVEMEGGRWRKPVKGEVKQDVLLENHIRVRGLDLWDVYPDPEAGDVENLRYIQWQQIIDIDELWRYIEGTRKSKKWRVGTKADLEPLRGSVRAEHRWHKKMQAQVDRLDRQFGEGFTARDEDERLIRIIHHWEPEWHVIVAGEMNSSAKRGRNGMEHPGHMVLLVERNPFKRLRLPFVRLVVTNLDNELHGIGVIEQIEQLAHLVNTLTNLRLVNVERGTNPIGLVDNMSGLYAETLMSHPGGFYNTDGTVPLDRVLRFEQVNVVNDDAWREVDYAMQQIQTTAGASNFQMGQVAEGFNDTARGIGMLMQAGNSRFKLQVKMLGVGLRQLADAMLRVDQQFITGMQMVPMEGDDGHPRHQLVTPRDLSRDYVLRFTVRPEAANKALQLQQVINAAQIAAALDPQGEILERREVVKEMFHLAELPRPSRFLAQPTNDAHLENDAVLRFGKVLPPAPFDNHEQHLEVHKAVKRSELMQKWGPAVADEWERVMLQGHLQATGLLQTPGAGPPPGGGVGAGQQPPQAPSELAQATGPAMQGQGMPGVG